MITRWSAPRSLRELAVCTLGVGALLAACGGEDAPESAPTVTTTSATTTATTPASSAPSSPTATGGFDCASVNTAQRALDEAYATELDRLGIDRGDPRAQSVFTIVTTNEGPTYYAAVLAAAPAEQSSDAVVVQNYYQQLSAQAGVLDPGTGSAEDLSAAMAALDEATTVVSPDASTATQVVQAQERLQAAVGRSCSGATASASPTGSSTTTGG